MASKYVKYGATYGDVKEQALKNIVTVCSEIVKNFGQITEGETAHSKSEYTYLALESLKYVRRDIENTRAEDSSYDMLFFLTRKSNVEKLARKSVKEIANIGLLTPEFTRLTDLVSKILWDETIAYFRANYRSYKFETTEDGKKLWVRTRDKTVRFDAMLKQVELDGMKLEMYNGDYCVVHSRNRKGAKK